MNPENLTMLVSDARKNYYYKALYNARIPERYKDKTLESFEGNEDKVEMAKKSIESGESVFLHGSTGSGKTHLAVALLKKWLHAETIKNVVDREYYMSIRFPIFLPSVDLFFELKSSFDKSGDSESDIINKYVSTPLLVIDDIGAEKVSDWSRQVFYLLIDRRYREMKPTILTSNLSLQQIAEVIDERISSRICEMGVVAELTGKDRRVKK